MLALAPLAGIFATGSEELLEKKLSFFCMLCKKNNSLRSRGLYELKRHYQRDCHLWKDERFREQLFPGKTRRRDDQVLFVTKLETKREQDMDLDVPDLCHKRPFYYDVVEGKLSTSTTESSRSRILIELLLTFLKSAGHLWALESFWNQAGMMTGHSVSTADFNWSWSQIAVSVI